MSRRLLGVLAVLLVLSAAIPAPVAAQSDENTTASEIIELVESVEPSDATEEQIQRVIDWASDTENIRNISESEYREIRSWLSNAADSHNSIHIALPDFPSIDEAGEAINDRTGSGDGADSEESGPPLGDPATLAVSQPEYHGSTNTVTDGGRTIYIVDAQRVEIQPQNFNNDNVIGFGVSEGPGDLSYDNQMDEFVFQTNGEVGTFQLYWEVEERVRVGNDTETARTRYTATIRADSNQTYQHVTRGELEKQQSDAQNWSAWESQIKDIHGEDANVQQETQWSVDMHELRANPLGALSGNFTGLLLAMFITLGGMLLLSLIGVLHLAARWTDIKYINRFESLKSEERDVDKRLSDLDWREKMRSVAKWDWNDFFGDYVSRAYRKIAPTAFRGMKRLKAVRRPRNMVDFRTQVMVQDGYEAVVERDDVATDGGDDGAERPIVGAAVVPEAQVEEDAETLSPTDDEWDEFLDVLDWQSETLTNYSVSSADVSPDDIHVEQAPLTLEELTEELGADLRDFDSRQHWGQYMLEFVEYVRDHEYCDEEGRPNDIQFVLNQWMDADDFLSDAFELPYYKYESEALEWAVKHADPVEEADQRVSKATEGRDLDLE